MKLYRKYIRPMHSYPGPYYEPRKKPVEKEEKWYPEEELGHLQMKYAYLNDGHFSHLIFDEKYEPYAIDGPTGEHCSKTVKELKNAINDISSRDDNKAIVFCGSALNKKSYDDLDISWIDCSDGIVICVNESPT